MNAHKSPLITNESDRYYQRLRSLQTPTGRARTGLYLIEGIRLVSRALEERAPIESLFVDPSVLCNSYGRKLKDRLARDGVPCHRLSPPLYRDLTRAAEPQGIGAVLRQQWTPLAALPRHPAALYLAVESIDSAGNLGTMLRTAEAAGVTAVIMIGQGADPHDPTAVRASMGALLAHTLARTTPSEFLQWTRTAGIACIGSSPTGLLDYRGFPCPSPAALLIGSEKQGLSPQVLESCHFLVRIPMLGRGDSINAAVAAGLLLYAMSPAVQPQSLA